MNLSHPVVMSSYEEEVKSKTNLETKLRRISQIGSHPDLNWSHSLRDLFSKMVAYRPENRISYEEIFQHPWLCSKVKNEKKNNNPI